LGGLLGAILSFALNPMGTLFGILLGTNIFGEFLLGMVFSVGFAVIGWYLGMKSRGGRR